MFTLCAITAKAGVKRALSVELPCGVELKMIRNSTMLRSIENSSNILDILGTKHLGLSLVEAFILNLF